MKKIRESNTRVIPEPVVRDHYIALDHVRKALYRVNKNTINNRALTDILEEARRQLLDKIRLMEDANQGEKRP